MANIVYYTLYLTNGGSAATGLTPQTTSVIGIPSGTDYALAPYSVSLNWSELSNGFYLMEIDWDSFDPSDGAEDDTIFLLSIDAGSTISSPSERYLTQRIELVDSYDNLTKKMVQRILDIEEGNWRIEDDQLKIYDSTDTLLDTFDLADVDGHSTEANPYSRVSSYKRGV